MVGERLTKALVTGDFDIYRQVMDLPITIEPRGGEPVTLTDIDALQADFDLYRMAIKARRITDIYREIKEINQTEEGHFEVVCDLHILSHAERVVEPFESKMTLRKVGDDWRFCHIRSSLRHIQWTRGEAGL